MLASALVSAMAFGSAAEDRKLLRAELSPSKNLLNNSSWKVWEYGFTTDNGLIFCDNGNDAQTIRGAGQTILLNQKTPMPILASAWSRGDGIGGRADSNYSLYLDILYMDGENLYGQAAPFSVGTHDWEQRQVMLIPPKPVKSVSCFLLFRRHCGKAWFRDVTLSQLDSDAKFALFDGVPILAPKSILHAPGFFLRDAAANSDFISCPNSQALGLKLESSTSSHADAAFVDIELSELTGKDRSVTLLCVLPLGEGDVRWFGAPSKEIECRAPVEYLNAELFPGVANSRLGRFPLGAVACGDKGFALGLDMAYPAFFRIGYNHATRELFIAFDLGFTPEKPKAHLRFCAWEFEPEWGFRAAWGKYEKLFPEFFRARAPEHGLWMPFAKISEIKNWQDFGFKFKEGNDETVWDDEHGIITFRYTEPMTWWMHMPKEIPRTLPAALDEARRIANDPKDLSSSAAKALFSSGYHDENGQFIAQLLDMPWCDGAVWSMNSMPDIQGEISDFKRKWNPALREELYGPGRKGDLDGEYVDSTEGYVTAILDFRREHFSAARTPLAFSSGSFKPGIFKGLVAYEYIRALSEELHGMDKLIMGNGTPTQNCWLAPWLDVMGTETDWNPNNKWTPMSRSEFLYRRILAGPKPFCFLMNTNFANFSHEMSEKFMKRSTAYGFFPGFFSENAASGQYFTRPELYERDRDLFKKYVPLCKRLSEAGWQAVPLVKSSSPQVFVERFGEKLLTVFNEGRDACAIRLTREGLPPKNCRELLSGRELYWTSSADKRSASVSLRLGPEDLAVLELELAD